MSPRGGGRPEPEPGLVLIDKPAGWTSHDVIAKLRGMLGTRKVGHAGTLDPMATGLLLVAVGKATKLLTYLSGADKEYDATILLGAATVTDDAEGEVTSTADASRVTDAQVAAAIEALSGDIMQVPSAVSAIKIDGKRSYARVRAGEDVEIPARPATVRWSRVGPLRPGDITAPRADGAGADHDAGNAVILDATVTVSSGTYVRALARDLGEALGVGGHLTALRRTRVGGFALADAVTMDQMQALADAGEARVSIPLAEAAAGALPSVSVADADREELRHGRRVAIAGAPANAASAIEPDQHFAALSSAGTLVAIVAGTGDWWQPVIVFEGAS